MQVPLPHYIHASTDQVIASGLIGRTQYYGRQGLAHLFHRMIIDITIASLRRFERVECGANQRLLDEVYNEPVSSIQSLTSIQTY